MGGVTAPGFAAVAPQGAGCVAGVLVAPRGWLCRGVLVAPQGRAVAVVSVPVTALDGDARHQAARRARAIACSMRRRSRAGSARSAQTTRTTSYPSARRLSSRGFSATSTSAPREQSWYFTRPSNSSTTGASSRRKSTRRCSARHAPTPVGLPSREGRAGGRPVGSPPATRVVRPQTAGQPAPPPSPAAAAAPLPRRPGHPQ